MKRFQISEFKKCYKFIAIFYFNRENSGQTRTRQSHQEYVQIPECNRGVL